MTPLLPAPLFAFGFGSPLLLWGLAAGGIPLIIHLLHRRRYREVPWAAMRFLIAAIKKNARRVRLEQWLLLAVRTALVVWFVLALARPQGQALAPFLTPDAPAHKILVLDASYSMGCLQGGQTAFQAGQQALEAVVGSARPGDAFNLLRIGGSEPRTMIGQPAFRTGEVLREIAGVSLPHERGDVLRTLHEVRQVLQREPGLPQKQVYLVSDFQRNSWSPEIAGQAAEIRRVLRELTQAARVVAIDVGWRGAGNQALTDFTCVEPFVAVGRPAVFRGTAVTFGQTVASQRTVEFLVDGKLQGQQAVTLQPGTETSVQFVHTFEGAGEHRVQLRLDDDPVPVDNVRSLVIPAKQHVQVLCVNGRLSGRPRDTATFHLELALAPQAAAGMGTTADVIHPRVIKSGELRGFDLSTCDCVCLCNVSSFDANEAALLESYLRAGGGVIWALGDRVQPENYNRLLYRDGAGILPAQIDGRHGDAQQRQQTFSFDPRDFQHPLVNVFQGNPDAGLETTPTYEYFRVTLPRSGRSQVALAFDNGDPAVVETRVEEGRAILVTTSLDETWGNWAVWPSFVPLMHELVTFAIRGRTGPRQVRVGEPLLRVVPARGAEVSAHVRRPDGSEVLVPQTARGDLPELIVERTDLSGYYELSWQAPWPGSETFAVNVDPQEGNLEALDRTELEQDLFGGAPVTYQTDFEPLAPVASTPALISDSLSQWWLLGVLYLMFVEQVLAWTPRYGLWLLCPPWGLYAAWRAWRRPISSGLV